jgi:ketosteroid isomerase-like protein
MDKAGTLTELAQELFSDLDAERFDQLVDRATEDVQGVDEISRRWLRGRAAMQTYLDGLRGNIAGIHSTLRDTREADFGDVGLVTATLEQTYSLSGRNETIVAPTSILFRREDGTWKFALLHSVPIPETANS